jgi:hypothetical protein
MPPAAVFVNCVYTIKISQYFWHLLLLLLLLLTEIELSLGGSIPYTSTNKMRINTHKKETIQKPQYKQHKTE